MFMSCSWSYQLFVVNLMVLNLFVPVYLLRWEIKSFVIRQAVRATWFIICPVLQLSTDYSGTIWWSRIVSFSNVFVVNPLDVVKIRLQAQHMPLKTNSLFVYHRGILEELCVCRYCSSGEAGISAGVRPWYNRQIQFTGTLVSQSFLRTKNGNNFVSYT